MNDKCPKCGAIHGPSLIRMDFLQVRNGELEITAKNHGAFAELTGLWLDEVQCLRRQLQHCLDGRDAERAEAHRAIVKLEGELQQAQAELAAAREQVKRLEGIVATLPTTADGVPIIPGMEVWTAYWAGPRREVVASFDVYVQEPTIWSCAEADASTLYSTRAAAEAAKEK